MPLAAQNVVQFPSSTPVEMRRYPLQDGDPGIARTVKLMRGLVNGSEGAIHPAVRQAAIQIVRGLDSKDKQGQISAVFDWVKHNIDFRGEYKELLQSPVITLQLQAGDCDDHSMLSSALLKSLGFNTRYQTVAADAEDPNQFTHVYCEVLDPTTQQWVPLDTTVKKSYPGWSPETVYRQKAWQPMGDAGDPSLTTDVVGLLSPLDQALAYKIAGTTPVVGDFNFGNLWSSTSGSPGGVPWVYIFMGGFFLWLLTRRR
jgi:hypothetical protein